ncbi:MAG: hypothetical protein IJK30_13600 [Ruminococcus sp.]|nr:hypothetical protein [Ruminococcus sp.]
MDYICKMCGGIISPDDGTGVCDCEHCGSRQTYPLRYFGDHAEMYNKACQLRLKTDFEGAEKLFTRLSEEIPNESEGFWGVLMCRCGLEYEDDPISGMKIPVCSRTATGEITADPNYHAALLTATPSQGAFYRREAAALEMLRRETVERVGTGEKYDVFICCRLTDESGRSTPDSIVAEEICHQLTEEGMKVFYAPVTLTDIPESEYEPYVNAAIGNSSALLAVGCKAENFAAPKFRSEWSRCGAAVKRGESRLFYVCIKNTDPRDLPTELREYPVKDVTRMGFLTEVIRSINALGDSSGSRPRSIAKKTPEKLIRRMKIFLADEDFDAAEEYSGLILDADPYCWQAHFARFLADNGCRSTDDLMLEEMVGSFADDYIERFGFDFTDDDIYRAQLSDMLGSSLRSALRFAEGEDSVRLTTLYERFVSAVRDSIFVREQEQIDSEEQAEMEKLRQLHAEEETERESRKRKKQVIKARFLGYMAVIAAVLLVLAIKFHFKFAIVLIAVLVVLMILVFAGLEK